MSLFRAIRKIRYILYRTSIIGFVAGAIAKAMVK